MLILHKAGGSTYEVGVRLFLRYRYETWPVRVANGRMQKAFGNTFIRRGVHMRRGDCTPAKELWHSFVFIYLIIELW